MKEKIAKISVLTNVVLTGAKIIVGFISHSSAILAEGFHSFMDIFTSLIGYIGIKIARKPADQKHPYGHYKFEVLAGFFITLTLFATGVGIIYEAYQKFLNPSLIKVPILAFGIMILSAILNEIMARIKIYFGKKENSITLLSDGFHSRIDVYVSLAVFVGLFLTKYWIYVDSLLAALIGFYVVKESFSLGIEAVDSLLDVSAGEEIENKIRKIVKTKNIEVKSLKTQKKGSVITADLEIALSKNLKVEEAEKISQDLREKLMSEIKNLSYVFIQIKSHKIESGFYKPSFGRGFGWQRRGKLKNELEKTAKQGPSGDCVCPKCGYQIPHERGVPCFTLKCPFCNINLERQ